MFHKAICSPIPNHSVAVFLISDIAAAMVSNAGQCFLLAEDPAVIDGLVKDAADLKRVIVRGERAMSTSVANLAPHVLSQVIECMVALDSNTCRSPSAAKILLINPDNPSPVASRFMQEIHAVERFAKMMTRPREADAAPISEPAWATSLGVSRAPRAAREAVIEAIGVFGQQINSPELVAQAKETIDNLRTRDASIGRKP